MNEFDPHASGCVRKGPIGCLTILLLGCLMIFTMCHVPKDKYGPYLSAGDTYYQAILGYQPKIIHDWLLADEAGGFEITVAFTDKQIKDHYTQLYLEYGAQNQNYRFRATSTKSNIVGLSEEETHLLEHSNAYAPFNAPLAKMLDELIDAEQNNQQIKELTNGGSLRFYSTDLAFWRRLLVNQPRLKKKSFEERLEWLSNQTNKHTYFYIGKYIQLEELSTAMLVKMIDGKEDQVREELKKQAFPIEVIRQFPVGSIYELEIENQQTSKLYESNDQQQLIKSRYEYPVTD